MSEARSVHLPPLGEAEFLALRASRSTAELEEACGRILVGSPYVSIDPHAVSALVPYLEGASPVSWDWMLDSRSVTDGERLFDFALNASLNGGYFFAGPHGCPSQWELKGSGSRALQAWMDGTRAEGLLPGHASVGGSDWVGKLRTSLAGQPYAEERLEAIQGFADPERRLRFDALAAHCLEGGRLRVDLEAVDRLAAIYPEALAEDPLRKKAILAFLLLAGNVACRGLEVEWDAAFPADYQLPRGCAWKGAISLSTEADAAIRDESGLLPIGSALVFHVRAATLIAVQSAARRADVPSWLADGALFMGFRNDPLFAAEAPPPMRVLGTWF